MGVSKRAAIVFYEKHGCINNGKQTKLLLAAGLEVEKHNLLETSFSTAELKTYFDGMQRQQWINKTAPRIKNGDLDPDSLSDEQLLQALCDDPILIRRPLMRFNGKRYCGFDWDLLCKDIGLASQPLTEDVETCAREAAAVKKALRSKTSDG